MFTFDRPLVPVLTALAMAGVFVVLAYCNDMCHLEAAWRPGGPDSTVPSSWQSVMNGSLRIGAIRAQPEALQLDFECTGRGAPSSVIHDYCSGPEGRRRLLRRLVDPEQ